MQGPRRRVPPLPSSQPPESLENVVSCSSSWRSLGEPVFPAERQEHANADLGLNCDGEGLLAEPGAGVALRLLRRGDRRVLQLLDVEVVLELTGHCEPTVQEDSQTQADR